MVLRIQKTSIALWIVSIILAAFAVPCLGDDLQKHDKFLPKREAYRYDGKTFEQWRTSMLTELKPERRVDALVAMKAFGTRGYEKEAVVAVMLLLEDHFREHGPDMRNREPSSGLKPDEDKVLAAARAALTAMPTTSQPFLLEGLKNSKEKIRWFCQDFLIGNLDYWGPCFRPTEDAVPLLMEVVQAENLDAAIPGVNVLANHLSLSEKYPDDFHEPLTEQMRNEALAAKFIKGLERTVGKSETSVQLLKYLGPVAKPAVPALLKALEKDDAFHGAIVQALEKIGCDDDQLVPHLVRMVEKNQAHEVVFASLTRLGPQAKPAVPALLASLKDPYRANGDELKLLEKIEVEPERVIPALMEGMKKDPKRTSVYILMPVDQTGLDYLGRLGPRAKDAVPGLVQGLKAIDDALGDGSYGSHKDAREPYIEVLGRIGPAAREALPLLNGIAKRCQSDFGGAGAARREIVSIQGEKK